MGRDHPRILVLISHLFLNGFCFTMGHFEAQSCPQNSLGSYSNSRMQGLTSSYSKFEFFEYSLDALHTRHVTEELGFLP